MTPGLAMFYGGMGQEEECSRHADAQLCCHRLVSVQWILIGYKPLVRPDINGLIGSLAWAGLSGVGVEPNP